MKNKSKILLIGIIVATIVISCFSGCGKKETVNADVATQAELDPKIIGDYGDLKLPIDDKFTEITVIATSSSSNLNDTDVIKELRKRTGLNVQIVAVPAASSAEKTRVMVASKETMTDIFGCSLSIDEQNDLGMQGAFVKVDEHLDIVPNMRKIFYDETEKYNTVGSIKNLYASDGHLYLFPVYNIYRKVNHGIMYRKDIFDKHGLTADWNGPEEFYQTLKKLKELYPESVPFSTKNKTATFEKFAQSWGFGNVTTGNSMYYNEDTKLWDFYGSDPKYKEILDFTKKLYNEGLLDPEFLTITDAAWATKMTAPDTTFVTYDWIGRMSMYKEQTAATVPDYDLRYARPVGPTGKTITLPNYGGGSVITANKNSELSLKLSDYIISESGAQLLSLGIEGKTYKIGEDGFAEYICLPEGEIASTTSLENYGLFVQAFYRRYDDRSVFFNYTPEEQEAQELPEKFANGFEPSDPSLTFTEEEIEVKTEYMPSLKAALEEFSTQYVLGNGGDKEWNEWLAKVEKLGVDQLRKIYNDAQKRYDAL